MSEAAPKTPITRPRRLRWPWILGGVAASIATLVVGLTLFFQFGLPWWNGDGDRTHVYVSSDGARQYYQVHLPPQHDDSTRLPVMMAIHGCGMTGFGWNSMKASTQFNALADREGFIVVYPTQRPFENPVNCWNSAESRNQIRGEGEPALLAGVAREVVETYGADPDRIHVSGASSGAGTAVILGVTYPDVFATVTSVAGENTDSTRWTPTILMRPHPPRPADGPGNRWATGRGRSPAHRPGRPG
ncbi:hypothetical protein ET445_08815 [Agromyces protaetiae]|uniref:PHB depolymerase family esterase n=1 Tax=Agromyces protaetiae TaxID=2509455 RepID=A0A4P6FHN5_9MICO|nr:PHB depolymerase family esterase [Agromyces protaetiae]QAY73427.1 hypothetical protein ET445_08815 [Agromyces protaetiae]